jgi:RHS repeat-associated protein
LPTPPTTDTVGRVAGLFVSKTSPGDVYKATYSWRADQLVTESQCLLSTSPTDKPRTVNYATASGDPNYLHGFDAALQLVHASRPTAAGSRFIDLGGAIGRRDYTYDALGNRTSATTDCWKFTGSYGDATRPDLLTSYTSVNNGPNPTGVTSPACDASPFSMLNYTYDGDGRTLSIKSPNDSTGAPAVDIEFNAGVDSHGAVGAVYKAISVNGATYEYWYDADGRRRAKMYPLGGNDEFFYGLDSGLLEDRGLVQTGTPSVSDSHPLDEYIWLAGRPIVLIRSMLDSSWRRGNDAPTANCTRNYVTSDPSRGGASACGVYFVVSDYLPKPVLMLDSNLHVVNAADYDPFGHVNRVTSLGHTPHPYAQVGQSILGYFSQPASSSTRVTLRARFAMVDTSGPTAYAYLANNQNTQLTNVNGSLSTTVFGPHGGMAVTQWMPIPTTAPSIGRARVIFHADTPASTQKGVALGGYEYNRFDAATNTQPTWLPIRFPGQYHDTETDLFQNWNRFYDPAIGRYLESEPLWYEPEKLLVVARRAGTAHLYAYAGNNPVGWVDPDGLEVANETDRELIVKPDTDGTVTIRDSGGNERQLEVKAGDSVTLQPGETFASPQDAVADPGMRGTEVLKTVDGVNVAVKQDGSIALSLDPNQSLLQDVKSVAGQTLEGGWKNEAWNAQLNAKGDKGWNNIFQAAKASGGYTVRRWP